MLDIKAPAKINLGLSILEKRPDGYHNIRTLFIALAWYDRISIRPSKELRLTCSDPTLPTNEENLVIRAARLISDRIGNEPGAEIHLEKKVAYGAGLGSGSSDAASTLLGLTEFWEADLAPADLAEMAIRIGSDVPFFLDPRPAIGQGRGDLLSYLDADKIDEVFPSSLSAAVVIPPFSVSTAEAYSRILPSRSNPGTDYESVLCGPREEWKKNLVNDFEPTLFDWYPQLRQIKHDLYQSGAFYASLSGSGSAVFGLYEQDDLARSAIDNSDYEGWAGRLLTSTR